MEYQQPAPIYTEQHNEMLQSSNPELRNSNPFQASNSSVPVHNPYVEPPKNGGNYPPLNAAPEQQPPKNEGSETFFNPYKQ